MHTLEILEEALQVAGRLGYTVRQEWLDGELGGACEFAGQKWIFLDIGSRVEDQLELVLEALRGDLAIRETTLSVHLKKLLDGRRAA